MTPQELVRALPDPWTIDFAEKTAESDEGGRSKGDTVEALTGLMMRHDAYRYLCHQVALIMAYGTKSERVTVATMLEVLEGVAMGYVGETDFIPEDLQEGGAQ